MTLNTRLSLSTQSESIKLLQITDTHLFADKEEMLLGVPTYKSFHAVVNSIQSENTKYDLIVCSGDITQDQSIESYQHFIDAMAKFDIPVVWLPGNHDHKLTMQKTLSASNLSDAKQILLGDAWQCILLDSQLSGVPKGALSTDQLQFLDVCLTSEQDRNSLIFIHHNPEPCGSQWLDQHKLENSDELAEVLSPHQSVKGIICGHIHQSIDSHFNNWSFHATPSTSIQFLPKSSTFSLDTQNPGWREFTLYPNGEFDTIVKRVQKVNYSVDISAKGYD